MRKFILIFIFYVFIAGSAGSEAVDRAPVKNIRPLRIQSQSLGREVECITVVPCAYDSSPARHFPTIYLLHGYGSSPAAWLSVAPLAQLADTFDVVFVCADGGQGSWWIDSPVREKSKYRTHLVEELIPVVDSLYRTIRDSSGRFLAGSSMGGFGALALLAARPELFDGAMSISGVLEPSAFPRQFGIRAVFGSPVKQPAAYDSISIQSMARKLAGRAKTIVLVCGTRDFALRSNRAAHQAFNDNGIAHEYRETSGEHTSAFVSREFPGALENLLRVRTAR